MEKLFLLDAYALIYRAYYAFIKNPSHQFEGFQHSSHHPGFVNTLEEVLRKENPTTSVLPSIRQDLRFATKLMKHTKHSGKRLRKLSGSRFLS